MNQSCVHELSQITYDRDELRGYYEDTKPSLKECPYVTAYTGTMRRWSVDNTAPVIAEIRSKFLPEIIENSGMIIFEQQAEFSFFPHIDYGRQVSIFYPIYPEDAGVGTTFYNPDIITEEDWAQQKKYVGMSHNMIDSQDIMYTHNEDDVIYYHCYSTTSPTLCNISTAHGVQNDHQQRTYLHISLFDYSFDECKTLIKQNRFFA
jgi:hypothetical protein